jgi:hypothetical protein
MGSEGLKAEEVLEKQLDLFRDLILAVLSSLSLRTPT